MNIEIERKFRKVLTNSLNTGQVNFLGERIDGKFNVYKESGFSSKIPLPRQTAIETLLRYFDTEEEIVQLFTYMLEHEGTRFYNTKLNIWGKVEFINLLIKHKWIYDHDLIQFFLDPFYEHEINFLKKVRIIDLRHEIQIEKIINEIEEISKGLKIQDLEWRITLRLYDLEPQIGELIRKIIELLLERQNLKARTYELFACLKELAINASKANYKLLFEKYFTRQQGITVENNYFHFLRLFKAEIDQNGNRRLLELARQEDKFINITFQSTNGSIDIWVTNSKNISLIEKQEILKRIEEGELQNKNVGIDGGEYAEGAGLGINIILSILRKYSRDKEPLKIIFYPGFVKIGFKLQRSELSDNV